jgi:hypothetical protein
MTDISKLSDQEKSVLLAKAMGCPAWITLPPGKWTEYNQFFNLYEVDSDGNPIHMPLAWRVLNWATEGDGNPNKIDGLQPRDILLCRFSEWLVGFSGVGFTIIVKESPASAQRLWLDCILELTIEAGIIDEATP